ncbi:hypothetical protein K438DRAFT_1990067 [Mycena galopus ATCC 62051]|nr:hypothetical protein K438DRAFT_1990067 [Mycena galopus ATCC 62051]
MSPWLGNLTHLELWNTEEVGELFVEVAPRYVSLVHLYFDMRYYDSEVQNSQFRIPSLKFLHIQISASGDHDAGYQYDSMDCFDTPALTELVIDGIHGDQLCLLFNWTSLLRASFPALTPFTLPTTHVHAKTAYSLPPQPLLPLPSSLR